jgi:hypothetical protein
MGVRNKKAIRVLLEASPGQRLPITSVRQHLTGLGWASDRIDAALDEVVAEGIAQRVPGGKSLQYTGSERGGGSGGIGLYNQVERVLEKHGVPGVYCGGPEVASTAHLRTGDGRLWVAPDLVMLCRERGSAPDQPLSVHTIEVETEAGFSVRSIYQAHAHGWGADYSWAMFKRRAAEPSLASDPDLERLLHTTRELGIGLVSFHNANSVGTWKVHMKARRRDRSRSARRCFAELLAPVMSIPR